MHKRSTGAIQFISDTHRSIDSLNFILLFPGGLNGWHLNQDLQLIDHEHPSRDRITCQKWYKYRLFQRQNESNHLFKSKRLFQAFVCVSFLRAENQKLNYLKFNQPSFTRTETLNALQENNGQDIPANLGKPIILSHTHPGSPRNMRENFRDSMAIVGSEGQPSLFITFTASPAWAEVKEHLDPNELPQDRLDLINKIFALKLDEFLKDVQKGVFGHCKSTILVTEYQSRGKYTSILLCSII